MITETTNFEIVKQLKTDIENAFSKVDNGYDTEVRDVQIGQFLWEDMKVKPSISIFPWQEDIAATVMGGRHTMDLYMYANLYMNMKDGWENLLKFVNDFNSFLLYSTDNTYVGETQIVPPVVYFIGWKQDPVLQAQINFFVRYKNNTNIGD